MWHEARKQERKIRGIMVDYKKRAERRRDFYEKIVSFRLCCCLYEGRRGGGAECCRFVFVGVKKVAI